jgi:hypothetical protein
MKRKPAARAPRSGRSLTCAGSFRASVLARCSWYRRLLEGSHHLRHSTYHGDSDASRAVASTFETAINYQLKVLLPRLSVDRNLLMSHRNS